MKTITFKLLLFLLFGLNLTILGQVSVTPKMKESYVSCYFTGGIFNTNNEKSALGGIDIMGYFKNSNFGIMSNVDIIVYGDGKGFLKDMNIGSGRYTYLNSQTLYSMNYALSALYKPFHLWVFNPYLAPGLGISILRIDRGVPDGYTVVQEGLTGQNIGFPIYGTLSIGTELLTKGNKNNLRFKIEYRKIFLRDRKDFDINGNALLFSIGFSDKSR